MFLAVLPLVVLFQVMPPPLGQLASTLILGRMGGGTDIIVAIPAPAGAPATAAPAEDCGCGVPNSPRGPR
ncbi:hypothetical protein GWK16_02130 [Roseomonas sp. JC162]|uniref:Uncharacterized protein n=1 Tax=Neoroseomonas marina TaxID=1232220 RepID=A0A848E783_9PROT|nr:hypothetical protein [Neoroseomonas marina]NMJ40022.1 hypothetical protein [Neoroseomonas marina]